MATKKYVSLEKLGIYDGKIKALIDSKDAATLKSAKDYADGLAVNYEKSGAAATAEANAKAYADGKDAAIAAAKKAGDDAAAAAVVADGKAVAAQSAADKAQGDVDELKTYVGTIPEGATSTNVVAYVQEKTAGIATSENLQELTNRVAQAETDIDNIEKDYLKAADKTELQGKIDAEAERAAGVEGGLETRLAAVEGDYLKAADKTELQGNINTVAGAVERLTNGVSADEVDGVNDLIQYVKDHGTEVTGMQEDIADNAEAIAGVAGRMTTAEGKITDVEDAVATKVEQEAYDTKIAALEGADAGQVERITALEGKFGEGEGSVSDMIADAQKTAIDAAKAADATADAKVLEDAKGYADGLNTAMDARMQAVEGKAHTHKNFDLLETYTQTEENLADAVAKKHEHDNATVLDGITAEKVTAWDKIGDKAEQTALQAEIDRAKAAEKANADAIAEFVEVSEEEINAMFA